MAGSAGLIFNDTSIDVLPLEIDTSDPQYFDLVKDFIKEGLVRFLIHTTTSTGSYSDYSNSTYPELLEHMNIEATAPLFIIKSLETNFKPGARILYASS